MTLKKTVNVRDELINTNINLNILYKKQSRCTEIERERKQLKKKISSSMKIL